MMDEAIRIDDVEGRGLEGASFLFSCRSCDDTFTDKTACMRHEWTQHMNSKSKMQPLATIDLTVDGDEDDEDMDMSHYNKENSPPNKLQDHTTELRSDQLQLQLDNLNFGIQTIYKCKICDKHLLTQIACMRHWNTTHRVDEKSSALTESLYLNDKRSLDTDSILDNPVTEVQINDNPVTGVQINDNPVTGVQINDNPVTGAQINDNPVTGVQINDNPVTGAQINDNPVTGVQINDKLPLVYKVKNSFDEDCHNDSGTSQEENDDLIFNIENDSSSDTMSDVENENELGLIQPNNLIQVNVHESKNYTETEEIIQSSQNKNSIDDIIEKVVKNLNGCKFCQRTFKTEGYVSTHEEKHCKLRFYEDNIQRSICKYCGKIFKNETYTRDHERRNCKKLQTIQVKKRIRLLKKYNNNTNTLYEENNTNTLYEEKNTSTICTICSRVFAKPAHLKLHMRAHIGKK